MFKTLVYMPNKWTNSWQFFKMDRLVYSYMIAVKRKKRKMFKKENIQWMGGATGVEPEEDSHFCYRHSRKDWDWNIQCREWGLVEDFHKNCQVISLMLNKVNFNKCKKKKSLKEYFIFREFFSLQFHKLLHKTRTGPSGQSSMVIIWFYSI